MDPTGPLKPLKSLNGLRPKVADCSICKEPVRAGDKFMRCEGGLFHADCGLVEPLSNQLCE